MLPEITSRLALDVLDEVARVLPKDADMLATDFLQTALGLVPLFGDTLVGPIGVGDVQRPQLESCYR